MSATDLATGGVPDGLTLLLGGARSGKSALAEELGRRHDARGGAVTYVATAPVVDDDMAARIDRHRAARPATWPTIEEEVDLVGAIRSADDAGDLVIVDCLTLWVSNLMHRERTGTEIVEVAERTAAVAARRAAPTVFVSNEVGLGVHPETELGRRYRDVLGHVNRTWAAAAHRSLLLVAGRAIPLVDPDTLW